MNLACPDWRERLAEGALPCADLPLNDAQAVKAVSIYNRLRLPDVPGRPTMGEAAAPWTGDLVASVFGAVETDDRGVVTRRTISKYFVLIPKKNGKTTTGAAIMLTAMLMNRRPRAEFLLIAPTQLIAETAFGQAQGIIDADPEGWLQKRFHVRDHKKMIVDRTTKAQLQIKTFDNKVVTGSKPVGVLIDELHELGKIPYADKVLAQLRGGIIANPEGFLLFITTQSDDRPAGVFRTELDFARAIRDGQAQGDMLPILYEMPLEMQADKEEPWRDSANWPLVLPSLGRPLRLEKLEAEYREASQKGGSELSIWASQHLNVEIGIAIRDGGWIGAKHWLPAADASITPEALIERCEVIVAGVDGGGLDDMLGLSLAGRCATTGDWLFAQRAWIHGEALEQRKENRPHYEAFIAEGTLVLCEDATQDERECAELICRMNDEGLMPEKFAVGLDAVGVAAIKDALIEGGLTDEQLAAVGQGYRLSGHIKGVERKLKNGTLWHDGSDLMAWCVGNARATVRGSATLIEKQQAGKAKIDPLIAMFNAFALLSRHPVAAGAVAPSPWDDPEFSLVSA